MNINKLILVNLFLIYSNYCISQNNPPPVATSTAENKLLVDKLIKEANYETYFISRCSNEISIYSEMNKWSADKEKKIIKSIDFKDFVSYIYNAFVEYSSEELKNLIHLLKQLNEKNEYDKPVILTKMIENNLEIFIKSLIQGLYIKK